MIQSFSFIAPVRASERASFSSDKKFQTTLYIAYERKNKKVGVIFFQALGCFLCYELPLFVNL